MNKLKKIAGMNSIPQALEILLSAENALDYNEEELLNKFPEGTTEKEAIASELCGLNKEVVLGFIKNLMLAERFFTNVAFNSESHIPLVIRAINMAKAEEYLKKT
jgi:hypothetical protein